MISVDTSGAGYSKAAADELFRRARDRAVHLPGVESASLAAGAPLASGFALALAAPGHAIPPSAAGGPYANAVSPSFFRTLGMRLRRGRPFAESESAPVVIVNETMARLVWPGEDALGRCVQVGGPEAPCSGVVGIAEDALLFRVGEQKAMQLYLPLPQAPPSLASRVLLVRLSAREAAPSALDRLRREMQAISPGLPYVDAYLLGDLIHAQERPWRTGLMTFGLFGGLALVLSAAGIYGALAQIVARRRRDLGIRLALGAEWPNALWAVARQSLAAVGLGAVAGLGSALLAGGFLEPLLFETSARDGRALALSVVALLGSVALAVGAAARRVRRVAPAESLRSE